MFNQKDLNLLSLRLKALSSTTRLKILLLIRYEPSSIRKISQNCDVVYNVAKKHIKIMQSSGLIITIKQGNLPCYKVDMVELGNTVKEFNHLYQLNYKNREVKR